MSIASENNQGKTSVVVTVHVLNKPMAMLKKTARLVYRFNKWCGVLVKVVKSDRMLRVKILAAVAWLLSTAPALAQSSYADPAGSGALVGAVNWLQSTLLGTVATVAAIIAVASVGFLMLTGRMNWRYGITVILGCFILFGAGSIVAGIQQTAAIGS